MADVTQKKRKRADKDENDESHPRKSRVVDSHAATADDHNRGQEHTGADLSAKSAISKPDGLSRQAKSERRSKKGKREKHAKVPKASVSDEDASIKATSIPTENGTSSKRHEQTKSSKTSEPKIAAENAIPVTTSKPSDSPNTSKPKKDRFIVFVGNLPYTATVSEIKSHFSKLADGIKSVRQSTDKATGRSKGFAFLEFDKYDKMQCCLKLYHHSIFDPDRKGDGAKEEADSDDDVDQAGQSRGRNQRYGAGTGKPKGRRINVELTAGGGGSGKERKEKIKGKNQKLDEERERIRLKQKEAKDKEEKKAARSKGTDANQTTLGERKVDGWEVDTRGEIHPSRMSRVNG